MTAREYLNQAYKLDQQINSKLEQLDVLRSMTRRVTTSYDSEVVSRTRNVASLENAIIRMMEAEETINHGIDRLVDLKSEISDVISKVKNTDYRLILEKRYLSFRTWEQIAADMNYSRRWVVSKHSKAVDVVDALLNAQKQQTI